MNSHPPCIAWAEKLALRREDLAQAEREALDAHVARCSACHQAQADYYFLDAALRTLPKPTVIPLPRLSFLSEEGDEGEWEVEEGGVAYREVPRSERALAWKRTAQMRRQSPGVFLSKRVGKALPFVAVACMLLCFGLITTMYNARTSEPTLSGTALITYRQHTGIVSAVAWSPDGDAIATASWDHTVQVWNAKTGVLLTTYTGHSEIVDTLAWSPNGKEIASGSWDHTVQIWDVATGRTIVTYKGHSDVAVDTLAWSPDGKEIAAGGRDTTVQIWDARNGTRLLTYRGHSKEVNALAWSPDGQYIASGSSDTTAQIWDAKTGETKLIYKGHSDSVDALAWSPNGSQIVTGSWDTTAQVWTTGV